MPRGECPHFDLRAACGCLMRIWARSREEAEAGLGPCGACLGDQALRRVLPSERLPAWTSPSPPWMAAKAARLRGAALAEAIGHFGRLPGLVHRLLETMQRRTDPAWWLAADHPILDALLRDALPLWYRATGAGGQQTVYRLEDLGEQLSLVQGLIDQGRKPAAAARLLQLAAGRQSQRDTYPYKGTELEAVLRDRAASLAEEGGRIALLEVDGPSAEEDPAWAALDRRARR